MLSNSLLLATAADGDGIPQDFIAYWPLETDVHDETGNYNGTPTNVSFISDGQGGTTADFNGTSSKIVIPSIIITSLSVWVNFDNLSRFESIMGHTSLVGNYLYWSITNLFLIGATTPYTLGTKLANTWVNVILNYVEVGTFGSLDLYINNTFIERVAINFPARLIFDLIGARTAGTDRWVDGSMKKMYVYDRELITEDRAALLAQGV